MWTTNPAETPYRKPANPSRALHNDLQSCLEPSRDDLCINLSLFLQIPPHLLWGVCVCVIILLVEKGTMILIAMHIKYFARLDQWYPLIKVISKLIFSTQNTTRKCTFFSSMFLWLQITVEPTESRATQWNCQLPRVKPFDPPFSF